MNRQLLSALYQSAFTRYGHTGRDLDSIAVRDGREQAAAARLEANCDAAVK